VNIRRDGLAAMGCYGGLKQIDFDMLLE